MSDEAILLHAEPLDWMLCREDHDAMSDLRREVFAWAKEAINGIDLMAIGAVAAEMDSISEDRERLCAAISISCTYRPEYMNGHGASIEVSDEGIALLTKQYIANGQGSSCDHHSETVARLTWEGGFRTVSIEDWIVTAKTLRHEGGQIRSDIAALPMF